MRRAKTNKLLHNANLNKVIDNIEEEEEDYESDDGFAYRIVRDQK